MRAGSGRFFYLFGRACLTAFLASSSSCALFSRPPALPRHAEIETKATPLADARFAALVQNADIIYFPTELLGAGLSSEPAAKLMEAMEGSGSSFAIGWDVIAVEEQPLLDQWTRGEISTEGLSSRLHLSGSEREHEKDRALLMEAKKRRARLVALRSPGAPRPRRNSRPSALSDSFASTGTKSCSSSSTGAISRPPAGYLISLRKKSRRVSWSSTHIRTSRRVPN